MAQATESTADSSTGGHERVLRAQLAITPHPDSHCAVVDAGVDASEVKHRLKVDPTQCNGEADVTRCTECHTELSFDEDGDSEHTYLKSAVSKKCICPVFGTHDCIPRIKAVKSGYLVVVLTVPDRETLREVIDGLRAVGAQITVEWLVDGGEHSETTEIDVSTITEKQQEALELAMERGYYETPRQTNIGELATQLGISNSAVSQRLNAAETKLVKAFIEE